MNRVLYWSIYGGALLLSAMLVAASLMAVGGFVPFRSAQSVLASPAGRNSLPAARFSPAPRGADFANEARRDDAGGWEAVWQARSEPSHAGLMRVASIDRIADSPARDTGSMRVSVAEVADPGRTEEAPRAEEMRGEAPGPQAPAVPPEEHAAGIPAWTTPAPTSGTPTVLAGLWPVIQPGPQGEPEVDDPADVPDTNDPGEGEPETSGGDGGDGNRGPLDGGSSDGPLRLSLVPSHSEVSAGEIVSVRVVLSEADDVSSVPFHVRFNDDVLEYVGAKSGPAFAGSSLQPILLASVNPARPDDLAVGLALVRSSGRFNGSGTVVVLDFRALQAGQSSLTLEKATVRDANSRPLTVRLEGAGLAVR